MFRLSLGDIVKKQSHIIGSHQTNAIAILDIHELGAGKLSALFSRHASRDLFDVHQLLTKHRLDTGLFRLYCIVYGAMGTKEKDWRNLSIPEVQFEKTELRQQLIPVLCKKIGNNWENWAANMLEECHKALTILLPLQDNEEEFIKRLIDYGEIRGSLLTEDESMINKIESHSLIQWKAILSRKKT